MSSQDQMAPARAQTDGGGTSRTRPALILAVLAMASFLGQLDVWITNVGLPNIGQGLGSTSLSDLSWVLKEIREEEPLKIAWIRVIDAAGTALIQDGSPVGSPIRPEKLRRTSDGTTSASEVRNTARGKVEVTLLQLQLARKRRRWLRASTARTALVINFRCLRLAVTADQQIIECKDAETITTRVN